MVLFISKIKVIIKKTRVTKRTVGAVLAVCCSALKRCTIAQCTFTPSQFRNAHSSHTNYLFTPLVLIHSERKAFRFYGRAIIGSHLSYLEHGARSGGV